MATATKRKAQKHRATGKNEARKGARPVAKAKAGEKQKSVASPPAAPGDDVEAPDRSAPSLAEVDTEVLEFIAAIDRFKKQHGRPFPSWSEVLLVLRELGYHRP